MLINSYSALLNQYLFSYILTCHYSLREKVET